MKYLSFLMLCIAPLSAEIDESKLIDYCQKLIDYSSDQLTHYSDKMPLEQKCFHYNKMMTMHQILYLVGQGYFDKKDQM